MLYLYLRVTEPQNMPLLLTKNRLLFVPAYLVPVAIYFWLWNSYAINIPKWDDHALKAFVLSFNAAPTLFGKIQTLFAQHNEHRIFWTRLVTIIDFTIFGKLNYVHLMFVANLGLVLIGIIFIRFFQKNKVSIWAALPIPYLTFTLAFWENTFWGMASVQNFWVVAWFLLTIHWLAQNRENRFWWAFGSAFMCVFTSGNGLMACAFGAAVLFLQFNWKRLFAWLVFSGVLGFSYFITYQKPVGIPSPETNFKIILKGFLAFLGAAGECFSTNDPLKLCIFIGATLLLIALTICVISLVQIVKDNQNEGILSNTYAPIFVITVLVCLLFNALLVSYSRAGFSLVTLITSRYKIYSVLLLITLFAYTTVQLWPWIQKSRTQFFFVFGTNITALFFFVAANHYHLNDAIDLRKFLVTGQFNGAINTPFSNDSVSVAVRKIYQPPAVFLDSLSISELPAPVFLPDSQNVSTPKSTDGFTFVMPSYQAQGLGDDGLYLIMRSKSRVYVFPAKRLRNGGFENLLNFETYFKDEAIVRVPYIETKPDFYRLYLLEKIYGKTKIFPTDKIIRMRASNDKIIQSNW